MAHVSTACKSQVGRNNFHPKNSGLKAQEKPMSKCKGHRRGTLLSRGRFRLFVLPRSSLVRAICFTQCTTLNIEFIQKPLPETLKLVFVQVLGHSMIQSNWHIKLVIKLLPEGYIASQWWRLDTNQKALLLKTMSYFSWEVKKLLQVTQVEMDAYVIPKYMHFLLYCDVSNPWNSIGFWILYLLEQ